MRERARGATALIAALALTVVGFSDASAGDARRVGTTTCAYDPATKVVTINFASTEGDLFQPQIERRGDRIGIRARYDQPLVCSGGTPTIHNTDRIDLTGTDDKLTVLLDLELQNGPLAPGATPEPGGKSEIEIESHVSDIEISITPSDKAERFSFGARGSDLVANLNASEKPDDPDLVLHAPEAPRLRDFLFAVAEYSGRDKGNLGNDVYSAAGGQAAGGPLPYAVLFVGGAGRDQLTGGDGYDTIYGGEDPDRLFGGRGQDRINSLGAQRDLVDCGPDKDRAESSDNDEIRNCERIADSN